MAATGYALLANPENGGGGGTVTSVSVVTANGISGTVATATTTPAITLALGAITPTSVNGNTFTTGTYTLTGAAAKTLAFNNSLTLAGTDATTMTFPSTSATIARSDAANTFTGIQAFAAQITIGVGTTSTALTDLLINPTTKASGNLLDLQVNSASKFSVTAAGVVNIGTTTLTNDGSSTLTINNSTRMTNMSSSGSIRGVTGTVPIGWLGVRANMKSPADGMIEYFKDDDTSGVRADFSTSGTYALKAIGGGDSAILTVNKVTTTGAITVPGVTTAALTSTGTFTSGAGASLGTLTNAPAAGNPTSWIKIVDNGVTRYVPAW